MSNQATTPENLNRDENMNQNRSRKGTEKGGSKRVVRTILSCVFSFMVALSLFFLSTVCIVRIVLSESFLKSCITDSYYTGVKEDVETDAWDYTIPTGIDPSVTEGLFNEAMIRLDLENYISSTFKIRQYTINTSSQEEVLREKVMAFLEAEGTPTETVNPADSEVELDEESVNAYNEAVETMKSAVDDYVNDIMDIYRKRIKITALDYIVKYGNEYSNYFPLLLIISVLFGVLNGFFCMKVHRLPHRGLRYLVYAFSGGFLMTFLAPFIVYLNGFFNRLSITPVYFKEFIVAYVKGTLALFMVISQAWLLIAIILGIIVAVLRKKSLRNHSKSSGRREQENKEEGLNEEADLFNETDITEEADWVKTAVEE